MGGHEPGRRSRVWPALAAVLGLGLLLRLPALLARHVLEDYDDGVYGASAIAMRDGFVPFRDVFSSQGPAFLPLVWLGDLLGGRTPTAPRLTAVLAGLAIVGCVHGIVRTDRWPDGWQPGALLAAGLAATSGLLLAVTSSLSADGVTAALGAGAFLACVRWQRARPPDRSGWLLLACGVLLGLALSTKSLFALPVVPAVTVVLLWERSLPPLARVGLAAAAVVAGLHLLWGLDAVIDQSVAFHLRAASGGPDVPAQGRRVAQLLLTRDLPLTAAVGLGAAGAWWAHRRDGRGGSGGLRRLLAGRGPVLPAALVWLGLTGLVLLGNTPLFAHHVSFLVTPAAVVAGCLVEPSRGLAAVLGLTLAWHAATVLPGLIPAVGPDPVEAALYDDIGGLGEVFVSDDPGVVWLSGNRTHPGLVDTSRVRMATGDLTADQVRAYAELPTTCGFLVWRGTFAPLRAIPESIPAFDQVRRYDADRVLWSRSSCTAGDR